MKINKLNLYNFRLFKEFCLEFNEGLNIIFGNNAIGKTTIIEAINYLGLTKSFKTSNDDDIVRNENNEFAVHGIIFNGENTSKLTVSKVGKIKKVSINEKYVKKISEYLGEFLVVVFSNYDQRSLLANSKDRRKLFEPIICQISEFYLSYYNYYNKLLNERNTLLKRLNFEYTDSLMKLIEVIDERFVLYASKIIQIRKKICEEINFVIEEIHYKISDKKEKLSIKYLPSCDAVELSAKLKNALKEDIKKGSTSFGPHRDDYRFIINENDLISHGSQGQQKNSLVSLKLAFVEIIKKEKNKYPILLLDDVFGELDKTRQNNLVLAIPDGVQTIITSSSITELDNKILDKANIINLKELKKYNDNVDNFVKKCW